ncbi:MAG: S26 family signal peptidase [Christensenellaceae bacterium]|nr:S26 family signal peptidase [Christensenellaceae bacterium]
MAGKRKFISQEYSTQQKGKNLKEGSKGSRGVTIIATLFFSVALLTGIGLISFTIVFFYSAVMGPSMMTVLNAKFDGTEASNTDSVIVNRYAKPKRGDIIVVNHYDPQGNFVELHIKRLIALGGESICFIDEGDHYNIEVHNNLGQLVSDANYPTLNTGVEHSNMKNDHYDRFYNYQIGGDPDDVDGTWLAESYRRSLDNNPGFRTHYLKDGVKTPFLQYHYGRKRYEFKLPDDYVFYMGDNRGGKNPSNNKSNDFARMSIDCTYFGPQPRSHIVGVVTELVQGKSAPQWFASKIVWLVTFKWAKK